jgi:hypothetical protein
VWVAAARAGRRPTFSSSEASLQALAAFRLAADGDLLGGGRIPPFAAAGRAHQRRVKPHGQDVLALALVPLEVAAGAAAHVHQVVLGGIDLARHPKISRSLSRVRQRSHLSALARMQSALLVRGSSVLMVMVTVGGLVIQAFSCDYIRIHAH